METLQAIEHTAAATGPVWKEAVLETGFTRGETHIDRIRLRKPKAGELRGLNLQDLLKADVGAVLGIIPRISDPIMTPDEAANLSSEDIAEIAGVVAGFFMNSAQQEMIRRMTSMS